MGNTSDLPEKNDTSVHLTDSTETMPEGVASDREIARLAHGPKRFIRNLAVLVPPYDDALPDGGWDSKSFEEALKLGHFAWSRISDPTHEGRNCYLLCNVSLDDVLYLVRKYRQDAALFIDKRESRTWQRTDQGKMELFSIKIIDPPFDMSDTDRIFDVASMGFLTWGHESFIIEKNENHEFFKAFFNFSDSNKEILARKVGYVEWHLQRLKMDEAEIDRRIDTCVNASSGYCRYANRSVLYGKYFIKNQEL